MATKQTQDIDLGLPRNEYNKPDGRLQRAVLTIETDKHYSGGLDATATVMWHSEHSRPAMLSLFYRIVATVFAYGLDIRRP